MSGVRIEQAYERREEILGYLDDLTVGGGIDSVCDDLRTIKTEGEILGLRLNAFKCEIVTAAYKANDFSTFDILVGFQIVDIRGAQLLGSPIISNRGLNTILDNKCCELERMLDRLKHLSSHPALTIIRNCISVSNVMHSLMTNKCFENPRLDTMVRTGLETVLNVQLTPQQWTQTCLPIREGDLGIQTTVSLATSAFMASGTSRTNTSFGCHCSQPIDSRKHHSLDDRLTPQRKPQQCFTPNQ